MFRILVMGFLSLGMQACAYSIHQVYISAADQNISYDGDKSPWVTVEASDTVILGFALQTDYVEQAYKALERKCPGRIGQVHTESLTDLNFLHYKQRIVLRGFCQKS